MTILLTLQFIIAIALIGIILLQRGGDNALGMGGSGSGNLFSARGAADIMTRITGVLAALFMINCLAMSMVAGHNAHKTSSILSSDASTQETTESK